MTGPREWRHASVCASVERIDRRWFATGRPCTCGLSAVRDAIAAGHRVVIGPDGVEGRLEQTYRFVVVEPAEPFYRLVPVSPSVDPEEG